MIQQTSYDLFDIRSALAMGAVVSNLSLYKWERGAAYGALSGDGSYMLFSFLLNNKIMVRYCYFLLLYFLSAADGNW